jgi:hypothetical protein
MIEFTTEELRYISKALEIVSDMLSDDLEDKEVYRSELKVWGLVDRKIHNYLTSIKGTKQTTKEIKDTADKLPKRKLKLEDVEKIFEEII